MKGRLLLFGLILALLVLAGIGLVIKLGKKVRPGQVGSHTSFPRSA